MKRIGVAISLFFACVAALGQTGAIQGHSFLGGTQSVTSGMKSANYLDGIIPQAAITVYLTGTTTKATIYSDALGTPLSNPFTSNATSSVNPGGYIFFAATAQGYDVVGSGGVAPNTYPAPVTLCKDCYPSSQFTVAAGVNEIIPGTDITCSPNVGGSCTGNVTVNGLGSSSAIAPFLAAPVPGQYVFVPATSSVINQNQGTATLSNTSGTLTLPDGGAGLLTVDVSWTGFTLPSYVVPANVTAVYAVAISSQTNFFLPNFGSPGEALTSIIVCGSQSLLGAGSSSGWPIQQVNALTSLTGTTISSANCEAKIDANFSGGGNLIIPQIGFIVYYTGTAPPANTGILVAQPLIYSPDTSQLSLALPNDVMADTGAANAYAVSLPAYNLTPGLSIKMLVGHNSTSTTPTLAFNGSYAYTIEGKTGGALSSGDMVTTIPAVLLWTGSAWLLQNAQVSGGGGGSVGGSGTGGFFACWSASTTLANCFADYGVTLANWITFSKPVQVNDTADPSQISIVYNSGYAPTGTAGAANYAADSSGNAEVNENNTGYARICTASNSVCSTSSGLSGMTSGQVPIAATATTVTSSEGLAGSGAGITTGPVSSTTANDIVTMNGTNGQIKDSGSLISSLAPLASPTFTGTPAAPTATGGTSTTQLATTAFVQAAIAAAGTGAGIVTYSGPSLSLTGTQYLPIGGGGLASTTETNVDIDSPAAVTVQNMTVQMSAAPGIGNSVTFTWRKNASSTALTCTISGASATACSDTTHNFTTVALDLLDIQAVTTGTVVGTPTVVMAAQVGIGTTGSVSSFSGDGALLNNSASTGPVTATLANAAANTVWGNQTGGSTTPSYGKVALPTLATQTADTVVMNATGGSAAPTAVVMPTCTTGADLYNTTTHSWSCVSTGGGSPIGASISWTNCTYNSSTDTCVTTGAVASVTAGSIPSGTCTDLSLTMIGQSSSGSSDYIVTQFNGDTGSNYNISGGSVSGTSSWSAFTTMGGTSAFLVNFASSSSTSNPGSGTCRIYDYAGSFRKQWTCQDTYNHSTWMGTEVSGGEWLSTSAVTSLLLKLNSGSNIVTGSKFQVKCAQ